MASLEASIDDLYKVPLGDFVRLRTALAKSLAGDEAKRVKALQKPTVVPWVVNQVFWHARPLYDRARQTGSALRAAQVSALEGRHADVRSATDSHRQAIAAALAEARRIAAEAGVQPNPDDVGRTLEAMAMAPEPPDQPGRLTQALTASSGFEALAGIAVKELPKKTPAAFPRAVPPASDDAARSHEGATGTGGEHRLAAERAREREEAAAQKKQQDAIRKADASVTRAEAAEASARETLDAAREAWTAAKEDLRKAQDARAALDDEM